LSALPIIHVSMYDDDGTTVIVRIAIQPADYVEFATDTVNDCKLKVHLIPPGRGSLYMRHMSDFFDPIHLHNVNLLITRSHFGFCDSLYE